jgi:hypothetical protein
VRLVPTPTGTVADHVYALDMAFIAAIQQAIANGVPQAAIVGVLAGHSLVQTQRLIGQDA